MAREQPARKPGEGIFGVIMLLISLGFAWQAYMISGLTGLSTPGAVPLAVAVVMVVASVVVVIGDARRPSSKQAAPNGRLSAFTTEITPPVIMVFAGLVVAYAAVLDTLGFLPASFLFLLAAIQFLYRRGIVRSFIIALLSLVVIYVVFRLIFKVVLPEGLVPEREIMAWLQQLFAGGGS